VLVSRIVSLLPSATEIVCALGLESSLVGITHECDYPPEVVGKPVLTRSLLPLDGLSSAEIDGAVNALLRTGHSPGSIYHIDADTLRAVAPDLILTQSLCEVCAVSFSEVQRAVAGVGGACRVESLEPSTIEEILATIALVGSLTGTTAEATRLVADLRCRLEAVSAAVRGAPPLRVCCMEWLDPPFGAGHWVPEQVRVAGGVEIFDREGLPSQRTTWDEVMARAPEVVVLLPCGYDLERTLAEIERTAPPPGWHTIPAVADGRVYATDGSAYFSRPGPRVIDGVEILGHALHPDRVPAPLAGRLARLERGSSRWS
jgi:iron complex transport system substrate-binding protein